MAELVLDQQQRDPFVQQLNGVRVAQLVRREPPPDSCLVRDLAASRSAPRWLTRYQAGAPENDDQGVETTAVASVRGLAHDSDDLINRRRVGGVALALVAGAFPA